MKELVGHPLFFVGLALRIGLLALVVPHAPAEWYVPFIGHSLAAPSWDPWTSYLQGGGDPAAFPYGYTMWLVFLPFSMLAAAVGLPLYLGYGLTLFVIDVVLLWLLRELIAAAKPRTFLSLYWLSPIVIFATYWLGLNDLIPIALLLGALHALANIRPRLAGTLAALAVSAKLSMVLAGPFLLFYLYHNKRLRRLVRPFVATGAVTFLVAYVPHMLSPGGRLMLFSNPEMGKVFDASFRLGATEVYLLPLVYALVLFAAWRVRRMSFELLLILLGIGFFLVLLLTPAAPGWYVWLAPFLVVYQAKSDNIARGLAAAFGLLYIALNVILASTPTALPAKAMAMQNMAVSPWFSPSMIQTLLVTIGLILAGRMLREGVHANEYYRLSRQPFVIGIAGDRGSGKTALAEAVCQLFGSHSVAHLSGDSYRFWDRHRPIWQVVTDLNPRTSDLTRMVEDVRALARGKRITVAQYDRETGRVGKVARIESNDFIIVTGVHALYLPVLRQTFDLAIYLELDETLRRRTVKPDTCDQEAEFDSIETRRPHDAARFVRPQADHADLTIVVSPLHQDHKNDVSTTVRTKLEVLAREGIYYESLIRVLIAVCGLHVDVYAENPDGSVGLTIEGDVSAEDVAMAAHHFLPHLPELLDLNPRWQDGALGIMQLIVLVHVAQSLRARL